MKFILSLTISSAFFLIACNDTGNKGSSLNGDTIGNKTDTSSIPGQNTTVSSPPAATVNFMDIMNKSMQDMKNVQSSGNPDNDFANLMKMHHMSAIEAAQAEISQGQDQDIKAMAQKMLDDQQKEVAEFNTFLSGHQAHGGGDAFYKEAMKGMNQMNMASDHSGPIDKQFVMMMIPHHQSAIDMAKAYIKTGAHEDKMKSMAGNIIASQQKEIKELQAWMNKNK